MAEIKAVVTIRDGMDEICVEVNALGEGQVMVHGTAEQAARQAVAAHAAATEDQSAPDE